MNHMAEQSYSRSGRIDSGVTCHTNTLKRRSEHERPLSSKDRKLNCEHGQNRTDDSGQVNVYVLTVSLGDRDVIGEVSSLENDRKERTGDVERPKVSNVGDPKYYSSEGHDLGDILISAQISLAQAYRYTHGRVEQGPEKCDSLCPFYNDPLGSLPEGQFASSVV